MTHSGRKFRCNSIITSVSISCEPKSPDPEVRSEQEHNFRCRNPQLQTLRDASVTAYAAIVYIRHFISQGLFRCQLLVAKIRVAPIKTICVPRLKLWAALL